MRSFGSADGMVTLAGMSLSWSAAISLGLVRGPKTGQLLGWGWL